MRTGLIVVSLVLAALGLHCHRLAEQGFGEIFTAAAVRSMLTGWHHFFYLSFDPAGFLCLDKPPLGFWLQALSAWVFGFDGWSLHFPQAVAGALSVGVMFLVLAPSFGRLGGLAGALALATTPICVSTHRTNRIDSLLLFMILLAVLAAVQAVHRACPSLAVLSLALLGVAFNVKYMQPLMILPALLCYLGLCSWVPPRRRLGALLLGMNLLLLGSCSWMWIVDSVPASQRPFIESSGDSRVASLLYNTTMTRVHMDSPNHEGGQPGWLRLVIMPQGALLGWLLPVALCGLLFAACRGSREQQREALLWGVWLLSLLVFFSFSQGVMHTYYLIMLAPALAAGTGMMVSQGVDRAAARGVGSLLLPVLVLANTLFVVVEWRSYSLCSRFPQAQMLPVAAAEALWLLCLLARLRGTLWKGGAATLVLANVLCLPALLSGLVACNAPVGLPVGVDGVLSRMAEQMARRDPLLDFLRRNNSGEPFLMATVSALTAAPFIVTTARPVLAMGGYAGNNPILDVAALERLIGQRQVRYFLLPTGGRKQRVLIAWIRQHGRLVPLQQWGPAVIDSAPLPNGEQDLRLYDCTPATLEDHPANTRRKGAASGS